MSPSPQTGAPSRSLQMRALDWIERVGNRLPDPALLFLILLVTVWVLSALLAQFEFTHIDPRSGAPVSVVNLLTGSALTSFLSGMVSTFVGFIRSVLCCWRCWVSVLPTTPVSSGRDCAPCSA